jgi:hypothetical protein
LLILEFGNLHSRSQQRTDQRVLVLTLKFLAIVFPSKICNPNFFDLFYVTFQCRPYNIFKKRFNLIFAHENIKKQASKVAHNRLQTFFSSTGPATQTSSKLIFHSINMSQDSSVSLSVVIYNPKVLNLGPCLKIQVSKLPSFMAFMKVPNMTLD